MPRMQIRKRESIQVDRLFVGRNAWMNPFGETWYVDTGGADTNGGHDPLDAFLTLDKARSASAAGDTIVIGPGTYTQTAAQQPLTPKARQCWMAAVENGMGVPTVIITGTAEALIVDVEVAGVVFIGIQFEADHNDTTYLVDVAESAAVAGLTFIRCWFHGNAKTTVTGINADDATFALTGLYVKECRFKDINTGINIGVLGFAGSMVEDSVFELRAAAATDVGIALADTGAGATGYGFIIRNNDFLGPTDFGADAVGITIAG